MRERVRVRVRVRGLGFALGVFHTTARAGERSRSALCWWKCSARRCSSRDLSSGLRKSTSCTASSLVRVRVRARARARARGQV
eukprot:scaffold41051_cov62-Phaeocystis_antarctica.AAC.2